MLLNIRPLLVPVALSLALNWSLGFNSSAAADGVDVSVADDETSVRVTVDGELFAVFQRSDRWKKPFLYPVLRPGWSQDEFAAGHAIVVADSPVLDEQGKATDKFVQSASRVAVVKRVGDLYHVPDVGGYLATTDAVPESALVVRTMEDAPMPYVRKNKKAYDHKHHRGVWISVDEVNGVKYWNEDGTIRSVLITAGRTDAGEATVELVNHWLSSSGEPVVEERTKYHFADNHLITANITFKNITSGDVTFADTKEGLFGVRVATEIRERNGGLISDAEGRETEANVWGHENRWVDNTGTKGGYVVGLTLFDHPKNPRPSRYHVRGYGLFAVNPFGQHAYSKKTQPTNHLVLKQGQTESFTYGLWIHGKTDYDGLQAIAEQFVEAH